MSRPLTPARLGRALDVMADLPPHLLEVVIERLIVQLDRRLPDPDLEPDVDREPEEDCCSAHDDAGTNTHGHYPRVTSLPGSEDDHEPSLGHPEGVVQRPADEVGGWQVIDGEVQDEGLTHRDHTTLFDHLRRPQVLARGDRTVTLAGYSWVRDRQVRFLMGGR